MPVFPRCAYRKLHPAVPPVAAGLLSVRPPVPSLPTLPSPVEPEALPVPLDHGLGLDENQGGSPSLPEPGQPDPEDPVPSAKARPFARSLEDRKLLPQREILGEEPGSVAEGSAEEHTGRGQRIHRRHRFEGRPGF
jgi:hypothetical protein